MSTVDEIPFPGCTEDWEYWNGMENALANIRDEIEMLSERIVGGNEAYASMHDYYRGMIAILRAGEAAAVAAMEQYRATPNERLARWIEQEDAKERADG